MENVAGNYEFRKFLRYDRENYYIDYIIIAHIITGYFPTY